MSKELIALVVVSFCFGMLSNHFLFFVPLRSDYDKLHKLAVGLHKNLNESINLTKKCRDIIFEIVERVNK